MIAEIADAGPQTLRGFDTVIDVRSPAEFADDHVPGAVNLPVLSDAERAEVGTIYVQDDPFRARRLGAALVARNISQHLEGPLAGQGGAWRPLVYCWRGGQRSNAIATVLAQVGWRTTLLRGGYKTYRRAVVKALYDAPPQPHVVLLSGGTGVGKTEVLNRLASLNVQTLDLEALADHRGSLFGAVPDRPQPSQKLFESRLRAALSLVDPDQPLVVEAESSKLGERVIPPRLWAAMLAAPSIELQATLEARTRRLVALYGSTEAAGPALSAALDRLPRHIANAERAQWREWLAAGDLHRLARDLIERHYDPAYARSAAKHPASPVSSICTGTGDEPDLMAAACAVADALFTKLAPGVR